MKATSLFLSLDVFTLVNIDNIFASKAEIGVAYEDTNTAKIAKITYCYNSSFRAWILEFLVFCIDVIIPA